MEEEVGKRMEINESASLCRSFLYRPEGFALYMHVNITVNTFKIVPQTLEDNLLVELLYKYMLIYICSEQIDSFHDMCMAC